MSRSSSGTRARLWFTLLLVWALVLATVPDPRPLGAPTWAVELLRSVAGIGEPSARVAATLALRVGGLGLLGVLAMLATGATRVDRRAVAAFVAAPILGVALLRLNLGYFPIDIQLWLCTVSVGCGALAGLALRRNPAAALALVGVTAGLFLWGSSTGIDDDLHAAARKTGRHLLALSDRVPQGDEGFMVLLELAFAFAEDNSHGTDPVLPNRAAILALGVILGEDRVADVARRHLDEEVMPQVHALRRRVTAFGRADWPRHFWVSAALTLLSDADRSIAVGLTKELMDATPGGTGFSFTDLAADAAGNRFTVAATRDADAARAMQRRILAGARLEDFLPDIRDLPEGLTRERFVEEFGGLGGDGTNRMVAEIRRRLDTCAGTK